MTARRSVERWSASFHHEFLTSRSSGWWRLKWDTEQWAELWLWTFKVSNIIYAARFQSESVFIKVCFVTDQVVFVPGFGCLYIDVSCERGTLVLSLAPEGSVDTVISQHSRYVQPVLPLGFLTYFTHKPLTQGLLLQISSLDEKCCHQWFYSLLYKIRNWHHFHHRRFKTFICSQYVWSLTQILWKFAGPVFCSLHITPEYFKDQMKCN